MTQLALDVFANDRIRPGVHPVAEHQRGWVRLPYTTAGLGAIGDIVPAWVCCRCGGVELNTYQLDVNHGCCTCWLGRSGTCVSQSLRARHRQAGIASEPYAPFDAHWLPERPP